MAEEFWHTVKGPDITGVAGGPFNTTLNVTGVPLPQLAVSVTVIKPPVVPKSTTIALVPAPDVIVAPEGTLQL